MNIIETKEYQKSYNKLLKKCTKEKERIQDIKDFLIGKNNLHEVLIDPLKNIYHIEQLHNNRNDFSARIDNRNNKLRLIMKPIGEYPYNTIEITDIEFIRIDNKHYERG